MNFCFQKRVLSNKYSVTSGRRELRDAGLRRWEFFPAPWPRAPCGQSHWVQAASIGDEAFFPVPWPSVLRGHGHWVQAASIGYELMPDFIFTRFSPSRLQFYWRRQSFVLKGSYSMFSTWRSFLLCFHYCRPAHVKIVHAAVLIDSRASCEVSGKFSGAAREEHHFLSSAGFGISGF